MAKKKLGIGTIEINKKFNSKEMAIKHAKRLKEFIKYTCITKAEKNWSAEAMIIVSNTRGSTSYIYYEKNGKAGRPKKKRKFSQFEINWYKGNMNIEWHIHLLLVSKPSYTFRNAIKRYIDEKWSNIPNIYEKCLFDLNKLERGIYKTKTNIGIAEYFIDQSEYILFCNYMSEEIVPKGYALKDLYKAYMRSRTAYNYCGKYIKNNNWEEKLKIDDEYYKLRDFYFDITKEQDQKEIDIFMKKVQIIKIEENYNKVQNIHHKRIWDNSPF